MTSSPLSAIDAKIIRDMVYQELRSRIIDATFPPGQRLQVDELARQLGVSRTPVNEALNLLAAEGLVRIVPRRGTFVADLTIEDVMETYDVRLALELAAAEKLVHRATPEEIQQLREAAAAVTADEDKADIDIDVHVRRNFAFHELFVQLSGNRKLLEIYRHLNAPIQTARIHYFRSSHWRQRLGQERDEHRAIIDALQRRDPQSLANAITAHIHRAKRSLTEDMKANAIRNRTDEGGDRK